MKTKFFALASTILISACATKGDVTKSASSYSYTQLAGDIIIDDGMIIDGSGEAGFVSDLVIRGEEIVHIGQVKNPDMALVQVIDAEGKVVTPGFIDTHSHGDPVDRPEMENFLAQGVTTICLGQDGGSVKASEMASYMEKVDAAKPGPNVITFVGHGTVRRESGIGLSENPTPEQIDGMVALVEQALEAGAYGMTTGLEYQPGTFSKKEELIAVAKPVGERGLAVLSHMRSEDDDQLAKSINELIEQCQAAGAKAHISHLKSVYGKGTERAEEIIEIIEDARNSGVEITADIYPYTASFTGISLLFPDYALPPNDYNEVVENQRDELFGYLDRRVTLRNGPEATLFGTGEDAGKTLAEVAKEKEKPFPDVLIKKGPRGGSAAYFVMNEELQSRLLAADGVNVCSDGSPTMRHPRGFGSFAKIIRKYVNEDNLFSLEEGIHKMSGLPATTITLAEDKRGMLKEGFYADVLIFDPESVQDMATFEDPYQLSAGFKNVIVNGKFAIKDGQFTGERHGRMLRK